MLELFGVQLGTVFQGGTLAILLAALIAYWRREVSIRGHDNADKADVRDTLLETLDHLTARMKSAEDRQRECEERETVLRRRVSKCEDEVTGLKRQIIRYSAETVQFLEGQCPSDLAPEAVASAERVTKITEGK
jgi:hypothetical protein